MRRPALRNANISQLQSKLNILSGLGIEALDLVKIINCHPRFLNYRINHCFDERLEFLKTLYESRDVLLVNVIISPLGIGLLLVYVFTCASLSFLVHHSYASYIKAFYYIVLLTSIYKELFIILT